jgi:hypothetical protein
MSLDRVKDRRKIPSQRGCDQLRRIEDSFPCHYLKLKYRAGCKLILPIAESA